MNRKKRCWDCHTHGTGHGWGGNLMIRGCPPPSSPKYWQMRAATNPGFLVIYPEDGSGRGSLGCPLCGALSGPQCCSLWGPTCQLWNLADGGHGSRPLLKALLKFVLCAIWFKGWKALLFKLLPTWLKFPPLEPLKSPKPLFRPAFFCVLGTRDPEKNEWSPLSGSLSNKVSWRLN